MAKFWYDFIPSIKYMTLFWVVWCVCVWCVVCGGGGGGDDGDSYMRNLE